MAKLSAINKNNRRIKLSNKFYIKRKKLKKIIMDKKLPLEERFKAQQKLSKMPRNSAKTRVMKKFKNATTMADSKGKFYVAQDGKDVCNLEIHNALKKGVSFEDLALIREVKHADTVLEAWLNAENMLVANRIIKSNTDRFSDEKISNKNLE